nr:TPA_exp: hypothetical protein CAETHG_RS14400_1 [Clostridium autoethanogenum DSM 10061]
MVTWWGSVTYTSYGGFVSLYPSFSTHSLNLAYTEMLILNMSPLKQTSHKGLQASILFPLQSPLSEWQVLYHCQKDCIQRCDK